MSPLELAKQLEEGVHRISQGEVVAQQLAEAARLQDDLSQVLSDVENVVSLAVSASSAGLSPDVAGLADCRRDAEKISPQTGRAKLDIDAITRFAKRVRAGSSAIEVSVATGWLELIESKVPQREGLAALATAFESLDPVSRRVAELRAVLRRVNVLRQTKPSVQSLAELDEAAVAIPRLVSSLVGDSASVRRFVELAARGGAPLSSFDPDVAVWVRDGRFNTAFKIVIGTPETQ